jgi:hypothetical protein
MLIDTRQEQRPAWEPNWHVVAPLLLAIVLGIVGVNTDGGVGLVLVIVAFAAACRALDVALPYREGLREHKQ